MENKLSKFDIGDLVWVINDNELWQGEISEINIRKNDNVENITYKVLIPNIEYNYSEYQLSKTPQEVAEKLLKGYKMYNNGNVK